MNDYYYTVVIRTRTQNEADQKAVRLADQFPGVNVLVHEPSTERRPS
jgi:hypothetical protein